MPENRELYDFKSLGKAIRAARESRGWTRDDLAKRVNIVPRYIASIENQGQHPSLQIFYELVTLFNISVDQYFFPKANDSISSPRRQLNAVLDERDDKELSVVSATANEILKYKRAED